MPKTALDYDMNFSEEGLRQALHQRGIPNVEAEPTPEGLKGKKSRLVFLAMQWDRGHLDDADQTYAEDVTNFGHKAMAAKELLSKVTLPAETQPEPQLDFDDSLQDPSDVVGPSSGPSTVQTGNYNAVPMAGPSGSLPESLKQEYSTKIAQMAQLESQLEALKAELINVQNRAESINRAEFEAWTQEKGFQRLRGSAK